jgi:hypothetical protein
LRDDATKTKQKSMDEVAQADFRTDAEREECDGVLPRAEVTRVAFLLVEETAAGKYAARFVEVQVAESPANLADDSRIEVRLQNGRSLMVGREFDPEHVRGLLAVVRQQGDRAAELTGDGPFAGGADLDGQ